MSETLQRELDRGSQLLRAGQLTAALHLAKSLLAQYPGHLAVHLFAADAASMNGDRGAALRCLETVPGGHLNVLVQLRKAELLFDDGQRGAALEVARAAAELVESEVWQLRAVARLFSDCHDLEGARAWLLRANEKVPANPQILYDLALAEFHLNLPDEAEQHIESLLQVQAAHSGALHLRSALRTQTPEHNHVADLQQRLQQPALSANMLTSLNFALAKEFEDLEQYEEAFGALEQGAGAHRKTLSYDSGQELASQAAIRKVFTRQAFESLGDGFEDESPVFIIGMPRTGTTLVERMLGSHSQAISIGEFSDFPRLFTDMMRSAEEAESGNDSATDLSLALDFHELGRRYVAAARQLARDSPRFVDKLPYNFLYCGYILAALPKARLIHLTRDPLDTCYAIYKTLFFRAYSYSYQLDELVDYFISYRKQMDHWHEVLPGRILDVSYEQLVQEPEAQARRVLDWCGLPWDEAVLKFHQQKSPSMTASAMQVRKPVNVDSIGAWRRAGSGFDRVRERLQGAGLIAD